MAISSRISELLLAHYLSQQRRTIPMVKLMGTMGDKSSLVDWRVVMRKQLQRDVKSMKMRDSFIVQATAI